jgi:DNA-binding response OmpR family regulator
MQVLLVEDEPLVSHVLRDMLEGDGWSVCEAANATEALRAAAAESEKSLLAVVDVGLPDASGWSVLSTLHTAKPHAGLIAVTGVLDSEPPPGLATQAGIGLLQKPFTEDVLLRTVHQVMDTAGAT